MNKEWCLKYGCLQGRLPESWVDQNLSLKEMSPFLLPEDNEIINSKISALFLGYYFNWDPIKNYEYAKRLGFKNRPEGPVMGIYDFADLDCMFISLHHFVKWYKFGIGRTFDNVSVEIRNGRMSREEAIETIKKNNDKINRQHLKTLCDFINISEEEFWRIIEKFRNTEIWKKDSKGKWHIPNFITGSTLYEDELK